MSVDGRFMLNQSRNWTVSSFVISFMTLYVLVAASNGMQAERLCSNKIPHFLTGGAG